MDKIAQALVEKGLVDDIASARKIVELYDLFHNRKCRAEFYFCLCKLHVENARKALARPLS